jgi:hypothetical protein
MHGLREVIEHGADAPRVLQVGMHEEPHVVWGDELRMGKD